MSEDGLDIWRSGQKSGVGNITPVAPAIVLVQPKYPHNVGQVVRLASCYGIRQVWYTGKRVLRAIDGQRLPREERMRRYEDVTLINHPDPLSRLMGQMPHATPVAVELRAGAESLPEFVHPTDRKPAIYVFGPEDGSLTGATVKRCHRFVCIPTYECLNLATAVGTVLYDRISKQATLDRPSVRGRGMEVV